MIAIIKTGGKQYKVSEGQKIKIEKLSDEIGTVVRFETLFIGDEKGVHIGTPVLETALVEGKIVAHERTKKVSGIKHKAKKRYLVRYGHRQHYTEVQIEKIAVK
ncbi:MAG: 50S ribosomal protein L21 [Minisyncoccota bacterium]